MTKNRLRQIIKEELLRESTMPRTDGAAGLFNVLGKAAGGIQDIADLKRVGVLPGVSGGMPGLIFGPGMAGASAAADMVISQASSLGLGGMGIKKQNMSMSDAMDAFGAAEGMMGMMAMMGQVPPVVTDMVNANKDLVFPSGGGSGYIFISMDLGAGAGVPGMPRISDVLGGMPGATPPFMGGIPGGIFKEGSVKPDRLKQIIKEELSRVVNEGWRAMTPVESMVDYFFRFPKFEARLGLSPEDYRVPGLHKRIAAWLKRSDDFSGYKPEEYDEAAMEIALRLGDQFRGSEEGRASFKRMQRHYERDIENPYGPESDY